MSSILNLGAASKGLVFLGEDIVHGLTVDKGRGAQGHGQLIARAVVVPQRLRAARGHLDGEQGGGDGRREAVQRGVNVPPVEPGVAQVVLGGDGGLVEGPVVRVPQAEVLEALVGGDGAVADDLDLRLVRDRLEIRVQDGALGVERLAVAVRGLGGRVEALRQLVLRLGRGV